MNLQEYLQAPQFKPLLRILRRDRIVVPEIDFEPNQEITFDSGKEAIFIRRSTSTCYASSLSGNSFNVNLHFPNGNLEGNTLNYIFATSRWGWSADFLLWKKCVFKNGFLYSEKVWDQHLNRQEEITYYDEKMHRHNNSGPAYTHFDTSTEEWYKHGKLHRLNGPAKITAEKQEYWENGKRIFDKIIEKSQDGTVYAKIWHIGLGKHVEHSFNDEPSMVKGGIKSWSFYGTLHRSTGPAWIENGAKAWYICGLMVSKAIVFSNNDKWSFLKNDPEAIKVIGSPTVEMQEYLIGLRPDLIGEIDGLDPKLKVKFEHELEISKVDL
jgi:hypothetical protein